MCLVYVGYRLGYRVDVPLEPALCHLSEARALMAKAGDRPRLMIAAVDRVLRDLDDGRPFPSRCLADLLGDFGS